MNGLFVLLGAPFLTHAAHTFLCAQHLALLGLFPLVYARGLGGEDWLEILGARAPLDECFGGLLGACAGAWLGAVPIPLDWDRDWQRWPVAIGPCWRSQYLLTWLGGCVRRLSTKPWATSEWGRSLIQVYTDAMGG